ncbi:MAG: thioredoxin family protein [Candidatus Aureabacteria bacterium]|nr:thioredoxin family protein [Candidatus Auribacterota bacterium]
MNTLTNPPSLKEHLSGDRKTAALFIMSTCPFCRRFRPIFESCAETRAGDFDSLTVILDDQDNPLWEEYGINVVPTIVVFQGGRVISRLDGKPGEGLNSKDLEPL